MRRGSESEDLITPRGRRRTGREGERKGEKGKPERTTRETRLTNKEREADEKRVKTARAQRKRMTALRCVVGKRSAVRYWLGGGIRTAGGGRRTADGGRPAGLIRLGSPSRRTRGVCRHRRRRPRSLASLVIISVADPAPPFGPRYGGYFSAAPAPALPRPPPPCHGRPRPATAAPAQLPCRRSPLRMLSAETPFYVSNVHQAGPSWHGPQPGIDASRKQRRTSEGQGEGEYCTRP